MGTAVPAGLFFEKTGGALDYMGVKIERLDEDLTLWAPGQSTQEYPGGWVTPGVYRISLNTSRIHDPDDGTLSGVLRPSHQLMGVVVREPISYAGWINHAFDDKIWPREWGQQKDIVLEAGDVLHISYGNQIVPLQKRSGSDGMVVYCVETAPEYRGGLWGTGDGTFVASVWNKLVARITEVASHYVVGGTSAHWVGPTPADPIPSDYGQDAGQPDNTQAHDVGGWLRNRAFKKIQDGVGWTGSLDELTRMFEFYCNNPQTCFLWSDGSAQDYTQAHGFGRYPPYQIDSILDALVAAVALDVDPSYEPLWRLLSHLAQRAEMSLPHQSSYLYDNNAYDGGLTNHRDDDNFTQWLWYTAQATDMMARGDRRTTVWGPGVWARELLGWDQTDATDDMCIVTGKASSGLRHGGPFLPSGAGGGYEAGYVAHLVEGCMWLWMNDTFNQSLLARFSRRNYLYQDTGDPLQDEAKSWWAMWCREYFLDAVTSCTAVEDPTNSDNVVLSWGAVTGADHYIVYRGTRNPYLKPFTPLAVLDSDVSGLTYTDLDPGAGDWVYAVAAADSGDREGAMCRPQYITVT